MRCMLLCLSLAFTIYMLPAEGVSFVSYKGAVRRICDEIANLKRGKAYTNSWSGVMEWSGAVEWSGIFGAGFLESMQVI